MAVVSISPAYKAVHRRWETALPLQNPDTQARISRASPCRLLPAFRAGSRKYRARGLNRSAACRPLRNCRRCRFRLYQPISLSGSRERFRAHPSSGPQETVPALLGVREIQDDPRTGFTQRNPRGHRFRLRAIALALRGAPAIVSSGNAHGPNDGCYGKSNAGSWRLKGGGFRPGNRHSGFKSRERHFRARESPVKCRERRADHCTTSLEVSRASRRVLQDIARSVARRRSKRRRRHSEYWRSSL